MLPACFSPLAGICAAISSRLARYAFDETSAHLLNNRTKSVKEYNDRFGLNTFDKYLYHMFLLLQPGCIRYCLSLH